MHHKLVNKEFQEKTKGKTTGKFWKTIGHFLKNKDTFWKTKDHF